MPAAAVAALTQVAPAARRPTPGRPAGRHLVLRRRAERRAHPTPVRVRALPTRAAAQLPVLREA